MKKLFLTLLVAAGITATAQVKVGTNPTSIDNSAMLQVDTTTKGFLPPRMTTGERDLIASPAKGLIVYNTSLDCLQVNKGTPAAPGWECIGASAAPTATVDCNATAFAGTYVSGTAMSGTNNYVVTVVNNSLSPVSVAMQSSDLVLSGVPGLAVGTPTPATLNLAGGASGTVSYPITGNPTACGTLTGVWTKISLTCTKTVSVAPGALLQPVTNFVFNNGEITGFTANWTAQAGATNYTVEHATTETGPWTAFSGSPFTGTSATISGLSPTTHYWYRVTINGGACSGAVVTSIAGCALKIDATTWKGFLCHNLGADNSIDPHTPVVGLQGAMVQWGRRGPNTTNDSRVDWKTAGNTIFFAAAPTASNPNAGAIGGWDATAAGANSWNTVSNTKGPTDPCPSGYRVPSSSNMTGVINNNLRTITGTFTFSTTNYGAAIHYGTNISPKLLTFPAAGGREAIGGSIGVTRGTWMRIWLATDGTIDSNRPWVFFGDNSSSAVGENGPGKQWGFSIRCIKE